MGPATSPTSVNVTAAYGAVNVAGPRARETLSRLTELDLSNDGFRYMRSARGEVAGVPCLLLRIGFVGETGWEVHFPAEYGEHMWHAIMEAGRDFGSRTLRARSTADSAAGKGPRHCRTGHRRHLDAAERGFRVGGPFRQG